MPSIRPARRFSGRSKSAASRSWQRNGWTPESIDPGDLNQGRGGVPPALKEPMGSVVPPFPQAGWQSYRTARPWPRSRACGAAAARIMAGLRGGRFCAEACREPGRLAARCSPKRRPAQAAPCARVVNWPGFPSSRATQSGSTVRVAVASTPLSMPGAIARVVSNAGAFLVTRKRRSVVHRALIDLFP